jgi:glycosyltransferase involved in cell wall biosynthesis
LKILSINFGLSGFAGDSNQLFTITKNLISLGHDVTIITTDADVWRGDSEKSKQYSKIRKILQNSIKKPIKINDVTVIPIHCTIHQLGMYCSDAKTFAEKIVKDYDVVHIYNWYHHLGITFAQVCNKQKIPFVISFYATLQENAHKYKKIQKDLVDFAYTKKLILKANMLHSIGKQETKEYEKWGVNPNNIFHVDNVISLEDYKLKKPTNIFTKLDIENNKKYIIFVSRIHPKKGLDLLLTAFAKILKSDLKTILVIAGTGSTEYEKQIRELVKTLEINDFIKFAGFVTNEEKQDLLKHAQAYVLTSRSDIHPTAIQDALAMGTPVMITEACDYPEVEEYNAGIIVDSTVDSIYEGLKKIINECDLKELSKNARKLIEEKFLVERLIKKYEEMYTKAINNLK